MKTKAIAIKYGISQDEFDSFIMENKMPYSGGLIMGLSVEDSKVQDYVHAFQEEKKRKEQLEIEYPNLIGKLNVLLGAGMTVYAAWKRIVENYCRRKETCGEKENPLYEEMLLTCHEIESGVSEAKAMERFGKRCGLHRYRKFCSLLTQNMRKGTRQLGALLENEVEDAFEERKNRAKQCGEEAGTKMLFPMMIMLGIVIAVVMIPAMMTLS